MNLLDGVTDDIRTPDKLIDGVNDTHDGRHMWLAPILPYTVSMGFQGKCFKNVLYRASLGH